MFPSMSAESCYLRKGGEHTKVGWKRKGQNVIPVLREVHNSREQL